MPDARRLITLGLVSVALAACTSSAGSTTSSNTPPAPEPTTTAQASRTPEKLPGGVLTSIQLDSGSAPAPLTTAFGSVWVGSHRSTTLYRIDPHRDAIVARIDLNQSTCGPINVGGGRIWTNYCDDGSAQIAVDPQTNQVVGSLHVLIIVGFHSGSGYGISANQGRVVRFDPRTARPIATLPVSGINGLFAGGYLWLAGGDADAGIYNGVLTKVDPRTGKVVDRIRTPRTESFPFFTTAGRTLWFKGATDPFLVRVDISTGKATKVLIPHDRPLDSFGDAIPFAAMGSLWVRTSNGTVSRLDARTGQVTKTYPADQIGAGGYVAVGDGSLWVANFDTDTLWRDKL